jgi:hypothetical protein
MQSAGAITPAGKQKPTLAVGFLFGCLVTDRSNRRESSKSPGRFGQRNAEELD